MKRIGRTQIIRCKCGSIVAGCVLPYCYSDAGLQKDMCKYVQKKYEVDIINSSDFTPEPCLCRELQQENRGEMEPELF